MAKWHIHGKKGGPVVVEAEYATADEHGNLYLHNARAAQYLTARQPIVAELVDEVIAVIPASEYIGVVKEE